MSRKKPEHDDPLTPAVQVGNWIANGTYRSVIHRHDGTFVAADQSEALFVRADTLALLADELLKWPKTASALPPAKFIGRVGQTEL